MKVFYNGLLMGHHHSGVQHCTEALLQELVRNTDSEFELEAFVKDRYINQIGASPHFRIHPVKGSSASRMHRIWKENFYLPVRSGQSGKDVCFHAPAYVLPRGIRCPTVLTVHDLIALEHPAYCSRANALYFRMWMPGSIQRASHLVAVSETVAQALQSRYQLPPNSVSVVHHGIRKEFAPFENQEELKRIRLKYRLPDRFVLFIGNLEPKKNIPRLLEAFAEVIRKSDLRHSLVIAGQKGWKFQAIFDTLQRLGIDDRVLLPGYIDQEDLPGLYTLADALTLPSLTEGFGLPALEAMACGTPALVSDRGALPETTGGHCPAVNPEDIHQIAGKLHEILSDEALRQQTIERGRRWARQFTWEVAAQKYQAIYAQTAAH